MTAVLDFYTSSEEGIIFSFEDIEQHSDNFVPFNKKVQEDTRIFDYHRYAQEISCPQPYPHIDTSLLSQKYPRALDMPLRLAGESEYRLPGEWSELLPLVKSIITVEHAHNPHVLDYHTYMTIDCKNVQREEQQRHGGLHVDGFQGTRINPKTKVTRNYVLTTNGGTRFYPQKFTVVNPTHLNVFQGFDLQAAEPMIAEENLVYFMNAYTVHESGLASRSGLRTFLRLTFDIKEFDREGNTHNSMMNYSWNMVKRNVHESMNCPMWDDVNNSPYSV